MHVARRIALGLLLLPVAEVALIVAAIALVGAAWTLGAMLATSVAGGLLLRYAGRGKIARFQATVAGGKTAAIAASGEAFFVVIAGILLLIPGFITDLLGILLLVPRVRRMIGTGLARRFHKQAAQADAIVDLDPDEWRRHPQQSLPRQGSPGDPP
jgi:UPF0716 protein FxsA